MGLRDPATDDLTDSEALKTVSAFSREFLMLSISVVGAFVGRIYLYPNNDPQLVIREKLAVKRKTIICLKKVTNSNDKKNRPATTG